MSEDKSIVKSNEVKEEQEEERQLDTIVTPGQLVLKRFLRNKLSVFGMFVLLFMFLLSYAGPFLSNYGQYEQFFKVDLDPAAYVTSSDGLVSQIQIGDGHVNWIYDLEATIAGELVVDKFTGHIFIPLADGSISELNPVSGGNEGEGGQEAGGDSVSGSRKVEVAEVARHTGKTMDELVKEPYTYEPEKSEKYELKFTDDEVIRISNKSGKEKSLFDDYVVDPSKTHITQLGDVLTLGKNKESGEDYFLYYQTESRGYRWERKANMGEAPYELYVLTTPRFKLNSNSEPSTQFILGTTNLGHDVFTRLMYGGRISLMVGFCVVLFELIIGTLLGGIAGYYGKAVDMVIMRIVDIFFCIPTMPLIMSLTFTLSKLKVIPIKYNIYVLMVIIGIFGWAGIARFVRGQILSLREQEYMLAAEATGIKPFNRIRKHLIPNVMPFLIVIATMGIGGTILYESALSFLGFGVSFPYASWGNMVNVINDPVVLRYYWWQWVPPGFCILMTVVAFNFVGDGLRDAYDPRMKR